MAALLEGSGTAHTRVAARAALAYLADPRHAAAWFARVAAEDLADGPARAGQTWRFVAVDNPGPGTTGGGRQRRTGARAMRLAAYELGRRFVWESALGRWRTNVRWELSTEPVSTGGTTLTLSVRWRPSPQGWLWVPLAAVFTRGALERRALRTVERAADAVEEFYPARDRRREPGGGSARRSGRR